jgi:hypothetical protein
MFVKLWIFDRLAASDVGVAELRAAWESVLPLRWAHQRWQLGRGVGSVWTALRYAVRVNRVGDFVVAALWLRTTALQICYLAARCMLHAMVTLGRVGSVSAATGWVSLCTAVVDDFGVFFVVNAAIFSIEQAAVPVTLGGRMRGLLDQYPRRAWIWPLGKLARADVRSWSRFKLQICEAIPTIAVIWVCARTIVALPYSLLVGFLHGESFTIFDAYRCISLRPLGRLWFTNLDDNSWRWPTVLKPWGVHRLLWKQWSAAERWSYALAWERGFALEHQQYPNDARCARAWNAHAIWGANAAPWSSAEEALPSTPQRASMPGDVQRFVIAAHACALLLIAASILGETKELNLIQRLDDVNRCVFFYVPVHLRESCSQFDSLPLTSLTIPTT